MHAQIHTIAFRGIETIDVTVQIARANHHLTYPARFQLIAAMNPCGCGYLGDPGRACSRAPSKLSGKDFGPDDGSF